MTKRALIKLAILCTTLFLLSFELVFCVCADISISSNFTSSGDGIFNSEIEFRNSPDKDGLEYASETSTPALGTKGLTQQKISQSYTMLQGRNQKVNLSLMSHNTNITGFSELRNYRLGCKHYISYNGNENSVSAFFGNETISYMSIGAQIDGDYEIAVRMVKPTFRHKRAFGEDVSFQGSFRIFYENEIRFFEPENLSDNDWLICP